ncbi:uncharacterized protein LOC127730106 isoform X3 [Mytilus californianus]|uniref:uncharacterized protein LOC127730106 isoform X3 n=1 Tax=Mytilus californianus TaxID=6549 RepID=UPI002247D6CF|nr:uncharacterized protein LOC127730106 isoform X3 [Mytilus californianus]
MNEEQFTPGLMGLNLNIMHALDMHMIEDAKHNIYKLIEKEHPALINVHKNMVALYKMKIPRERREARLELEQILENFPDHLNALADLEHIYRELHRFTDAENCRKTIEHKLNGKTRNSLQNKRICLLEQGYAILIERTLINENTVEQRITDLHKMLNTEYERSEGNRRECLERSLHHQMQVLRNVQNANEDEKIDGHILRKGSSLQKFEMAEKLSTKPLPHIVWVFYFAKALNQYYDSLEYISKLKDGMEDEMRAVTLKAIEKFWYITQEPSREDMKTFVARSYAYIGHILMKRKSLINSNSTIPELLEIPELKKLLNDPLQASKKAYELMPDDVTVLNRYGRALWNCVLQTDSMEIKLQQLYKSEKILSASIAKDGQRNWFAYSSRMVVRKDIANLERNNYEVAEDYLKKAKLDGHTCFKSKTTRKDMTVLAEVCQKLAKFPKTNDCGPEFVRDNNYLHQSLDYLFYSTYLGDPPEYHWTHRTASCLFDLGEYEQAIEWQRKAWFPSKGSSSYAFYMLCIYMLTMFEQRKMWGKSENPIFREFLYILIYGKNKYEDITRNLKGLYQIRRKEILRFFREVMQLKPMRIDEKNILEICLDNFITFSQTHRNIGREFRQLKSTLQEIVPEKEMEYVLSEIFKNPSIKPLKTGLKALSKSFKYDFFVSHSHIDGSWVDNIFLRHLESKFDESDVAFRGCIADRDFTPGISVLDNIIAAIGESNKVILVISESFVSSNWCQYEADQAVIRSLNSKDDNCIIPVLLGDCDLPDKIAHLNYVNLSTDTDFRREFRRLKLALMPEDK